ncbi:hypothetical protein NDU88_001803 [Pleurodeles waltl]|uniref:Uncharacterized protein n=1 Tax=Pleurodeles waltl TaxID=8319 RepID=A0AAV7V8U6_PLEWA|nr:hypothetical protein NDU88_001803 [Pleurodeles waltl]
MWCSARRPCHYGHHHEEVAYLLGERPSDPSGGHQCQQFGRYLAKEEISAESGKKVKWILSVRLSVGLLQRFRERVHL